MRFFGRTCLSAAFFGSVLVVAACIPDPKGEYEDYKEKVANLGPAPPIGNADASIDTKPPEQAVEALYIGICYASQLVTNPEQTLKFYTKTKFVPDGAGGGKLSLVVKPLVGWKDGGYAQPANVSDGETRGAAITVNDLVVQSGAGRFTANLGTLTLEPEANSLSGRPATIENAVLDGRFGDPEFCTTLGGRLTSPYVYDFVPKDNICLFTKVEEGGPVPVKQAEQFVCPL